tara:strand:+ start:100 stop:333 length:234 start_codon:yes stop_codon:yes gene_type:complete
VAKKFNIITNPLHYAKGTIEPKNFIIDHKLSWPIGNAVKYLARYPYKHKGEGQIQDLRKAIEYIQMEIDSLMDKDIK